MREPMDEQQGTPGRVKARLGNAAPVDATRVDRHAVTPSVGSLARLIENCGKDYGCGVAWSSLSAESLAASLATRGLSLDAEREAARLREFLRFLALEPTRSGDAPDGQPACEPFNVQELATAALDGLTLDEAKERCRNQGL